MSEVKRVRDQLKRAYQGEAWHGPSLKELLAGVSAEQAARRPLKDAHTIWELVAHVERWARAVHEALSGTPMPQEPYPDDWPAAGSTEAEWKAALEKLERTHQALFETLKTFPEERLKERVPGRHGYDYYFLLHGLAQHDLYHAGQIALLKKG